MQEGKITAIRGIVMDMYFGDTPPSIYDAVEVAGENSVGERVTIEVLQQLEDGYVRGISLQSTEGLMRGMKVTGT